MTATKQLLEIETDLVTITPCGIYSSGAGRFTHFWPIESLETVDVDIMEISEDYFIVDVAGIGVIHTTKVEELIFE